MLIQKNVSLKPLSTFKIGGTARFLSHITSINDLSQSYDFATNEKVPAYILGGGSNTIFGDAALDACILKMEMKGIDIIDENSDSVRIKVSAGEMWDDVVQFAVTNGYAGIETLSAIPGTTGATPIQNVGAYGQEIKNVLISAEVFDTTTHQVVEFSKHACALTYRNSVFKKKNNPYVVTSVIMELSKKPSQEPWYPELKKYIEEKRFNPLNLADIRKAVIQIREKKLPSVNAYPNCGSFFKNTIVSKTEAERLLQKFPYMPQFEYVDELRSDEMLVKIPTGWFIEKAGYKGVVKGKIGISFQNALVLYNDGHATFKDLMKVKDEIVAAVYNMFGVMIEMEPVVVM